MSDRFDDLVVLPALGAQLGLDLGDSAAACGRAGAYFSAATVDLDDYDHIVLCMSGGKDSIASLLHLLDLGVDRSRLELWHHDVDGREGSTLMDWPFMADYNRRLASAFEVPIYFSWLEGGFEAEMLKQDSYGRPHHVETPEGLLTLKRDTARAVPATRRKFPQVSASLQTRWCSSALKIDVGRRALNNQDRFNGKNVLFITGERRQESSNRARYYQLEPHACDRRHGKKARRVDAWRPVLDWDEERVWDALQRHRVLAPVPYRLGWGRSSCMKCIFNDASIWATLRHHFPGSLDAIADYEQQFGCTISRERIPIMDLSKRARPIEIHDVEALGQALDRTYRLPIFATDDTLWATPAGAFARTGCGPS
ncbi:phosphohydrolase [Pusillimonas sp. T2]|uniref:phosphoadenosine phosphosulfate reductase domain-containing protein n=1 Tax=Pusillimonas sp. T2 TaxID=1548123 RepID=UPI000B8B35AC|nr:phosphoadenosine phosphosulfate reductase family protein [Pusillimonas sp. T2]OXR48051.1 phosphohydrolase [Pusillimonas sp. T2]